MMVGRGRRPGKTDTRQEIIQSARAVFSEDGYGATSLRSIARRARVDPALVHHYFADKASLFAATMDLPVVDPKVVKEQVAAEGFSGAILIEHFLEQWEPTGGPGSPSFVGLAQAMAASSDVADNVRQFVIDRVGLHGPTGEPEELLVRRRSLISSQLMGIAWTRYVMRLEPMASASRKEIGRWAGPTIDRYAGGLLD